MINQSSPEYYALAGLSLVKWKHAYQDSYYLGC